MSDESEELGAEELLEQYGTQVFLDGEGDRHHSEKWMQECKTELLRRLHAYDCLKAQLASAPHAKGCHYNDVMDPECDCWKSKGCN